MVLKYSDSDQQRLGNCD